MAVTTIQNPRIQSAASAQSDPIERSEFAMNQVRRLHARRGAQVTCVEGTLWITIDYDPKDIVLERGQSYRFTDAADVCLAAFKPSVATSTGFKPARTWSMWRMLRTVVQVTSWRS